MIGGIIVLALQGNQDKRLKKHAFQAIFLGIVMIVVWVVFMFFFSFIGWIINVLIWLYGLYIGFEGYRGNDIAIPTITDYANRYSK